jgi:hypothetical protein
MNEIQRADPVARRRAVWVVVIGSLIGGVAIFAFERYRPGLEQWLVSDPDLLAPRLTTVTLFLAVIITAPLFVVAAYLWVRGTSVCRYQRFPLQGERLLRDTPVVRGQAAAVRGRVLQFFAVGLAVMATLLAWVLWGLATIVGNHAV